MDKSDNKWYVNWEIEKKVHLSQPNKWWGFIIQHIQSSKKEEWEIQLLIEEFFLGNVEWGNLYIK